MFEYRRIEHIDQVNTQNWMLKVQGIDYSLRRKTVYFEFTGATRLEDLDTCYNYLESYLRNMTADESADLFFLSQQSKQKLKILSSSKGLARLHDIMVRQGNMPEDDFWRGSLLIDSLHLSEREKAQLTGKLSRVLRIPHKPISRNHLQVDMLPEYKELIFRQLPHVREEFNNLVPHQKSEKKFWSHFFVEQQGEGQLFSDALEIKQPYNPPKLEPELKEELPLENGLYKCNSNPRKKASDLIKSYNHHSGQVLDAYHHKPPPPSTIKTAFKKLPRVLTSSESGAPEPTECSISLFDLIKAADPRASFPTIAESAETIRNVMLQTYQLRTETDTIDDTTKKAAASLYEVLKFFYSLFPLKSRAAVSQAVKTYEIILEQYREVTGSIRHGMTLKCLNSAVECLSYLIPPVRVWKTMDKR